MKRYLLINLYLLKKYLIPEQNTNLLQFQEDMENQLILIFLKNILKLHLMIHKKYKTLQYIKKNNFEICIKNNLSISQKN